MCADTAVEIEAEQDVHWGDIETCELTKVNLQRQILEDMLKFHPEVQDFYEDRLYVCSRLAAGSSSVSLTSHGSRR
jgi:hypothetical protein